MLETLLTAGDLGGAPWASTPFWWHWGVRVYNCPVLMLLQKGAKVSARGETVGEAGLLHSQPGGWWLLAAHL